MFQGTLCASAHDEKYPLTTAAATRASHGGQEEGHRPPVGEADHAHAGRIDQRVGLEHVEGPGQVPQVLGQRVPSAHHLVDQVGVAGVVVVGVPVGPLAEAPQVRRQHHVTPAGQFGGVVAAGGAPRDPARRSGTCPVRGRARPGPPSPVSADRRVPAGRPGPTWCPRCRRPPAAGGSRHTASSSVTSRSRGTRLRPRGQGLVETGRGTARATGSNLGRVVGQSVGLLGGHQPADHLVPGGEVASGVRELAHGRASSRLGRGGSGRRHRSDVPHGRTARADGRPGPYVATPVEQGTRLGAHWSR